MALFGHPFCLVMLNLYTGNVENSNFFIGITKPSEVSPPSGAYQAQRYISYKSIESGEPFNSRTQYLQNLILCQKYTHFCEQETRHICNHALKIQHLFLSGLWPAETHCYQMPDLRYFTNVCEDPLSKLVHFSNSYSTILFY